MNCLFCKIINKQEPADFVWESNSMIGIKSKYPEAPIHLLFIPKKHFEWKDDFSSEDLALLGELITGAKHIAYEHKIQEAYKFVFNVGKTAHFPHIHLHLLGGWKEKDIPR